MHGRRALVTGASEGIGRAVAGRLAAEGFRITAVARSEPRLEELLSALPGDGHCQLVADLIEPSALDTICEEVRGGGYDLVVNNAGFGVYAHFERVPLALYSQILDLNCRAVLPPASSAAGASSR